MLKYFDWVWLFEDHIDRLVDYKRKGHVAPNGKPYKTFSFGTKESYGLEDLETVMCDALQKYISERKGRVYIRKVPKLEKRGDWYIYSCRLCVGD